MPGLPTLLAGLLAAATLFLWRRERHRRTAAEESGGEAEAWRLRLVRAVVLLQEGVLILDPGGRVRLANPAAAALLGVPPLGGEEPLPAARAPTLAAFARWPGLVALAEEGDPEESVHRVLEERAASPPRPVPLLEATRTPLGGGWRLLVLRDLRSMESVDRKRRDFVANASHELQTPIAALVGILDLLDEVGEEERARLLERARRNAQSLADLTRDLLGLARAEDPDWRPSPRVFRAEEVAAGVLEPHRETAAAKGLELVLEVDPPDLELLADPLAFRTVLANLVENAVACTARGRVRVRLARRPDGVVTVEVEDTGPGIPAAILPRIFERFFRGDPARSREAGGTGLGLAIVRNLLRHMGGRIAVWSRPGVGSRFRVELPPNPARPLAGAGQADFKDSPRDLHGPR